MKQILSKFDLLSALIFILFLSISGYSQCSITGLLNSSDRTCGSFVGCSTIYVGDGTTPTTLTINQQLDLTCLGPITLVVKNSATIYFEASNRLTLAAGSNIVIETGGDLSETTPCSASQRIYIGSEIISSCNGGAGADSDFGELVANGGYNSITVTASPSSICASETSTLTASASGANSYKWYNVVSGGTPVIPSPDPTKYNTGPISSTTTYYVEGVYSTYTTARKAITVTVNPNLPASVSITASPSGTICSGTSVTFTATPTNGGTSPGYQWYKGTTPISGATSPTYTSPTMANSDAIKVIMTSNATPCLTGSPASSNTIAMIVNDSPTAPTVGTTTHPNCIVAKGSVVLNSLPASGTIIQTGSPNATYTITDTDGGTKTISDLASGNYYFAVSNGSCSSTTINVIINNPPATKTWNGTSWYPTGEPTIDNVVVFNGDYNSPSNIEACSCFVNNAVVVFNSGHTLKVANEVEVQSTGSLTFENNASLVQINDNATNSGNINYKRITTPILKFDFTYWSSPVVSFTLGGVSPNTLWDKYFSFDPITNYWHREDSSANMVPGKGYIIRGPQNFSTTVPSTHSATFIGVPNNGLIEYLGVGADQYYLLGNPYPSALDADAFLTQNSDILDGTLLFWTHNTAIQLASNIEAGKAGTGVYAYTSDDYAYYNLTGGVATSTVAESGGVMIPTGKIASGQSFVATTHGSGTINFNNSMRVGGLTGDNSQFFKINKNSKTTNTVKKNRLWLNLTNGQGAFKQLLLGYITNATNEYDNAFDTESQDSNKYIDFYSIVADKFLTIQGKALPFEITDEIPLGYKSTIAGNFTIKIDQTDGLFVSQDVFLKDKLLNTIYDLKQNPYTFSTEKGRFNERFALLYNNNNKEEILDSGIVLITNKYKELKVRTTENIINKIFVYDISGKQLFKKEEIDNSVFSIENLVSKNQILIVKTFLQNGKIIINKTIY